MSAMKQNDGHVELNCNTHVAPHGQYDPKCKCALIKT